MWGLPRLTTAGESCRSEGVNFAASLIVCTCCCCRETVSFQSAIRSRTEGSS